MRRTVSLADDERARVPFAIVGVVLLVGAATAVGVLETRPEPDYDRDPSLAMDRTVAATTTAMRDAVRRATDRVAARPVTRPANTSYGAVLASGDDPIFETYLRATIYLEVRNALERTNGSVRAAAGTASVPPVENASDLAAGVDRVSLSRPDDGLLEVTVEDVTVAVDRGGQRVAERTEPVSVTVATPLFELHEAAAAYERRLQTGPLEAGLGRQFSARLYALAWTRGYAQYAGAPVAEVIADRHVETAANDAILSTQRAAFGTEDPHGADAARRSWLCTAAKDAAELYEGYNGGERPDPPDEEFCDALAYVYGEPTGGEPPEAPTVRNLTANAPGMDAETTISVGHVADAALGSLFVDGSRDSDALSAALDRVHEVDVESTTSVSTTDPYAPPSPPDPGLGPGWEHTDTRWTNETTVEATRIDRDGAFDALEVAVTTSVTETHVWTNRSANATGDPVETSDEGEATFSVVVSLSGTHGPDARVDDRLGRLDVDRVYEPGGSPPYPNLGPVPDRAWDRLIDDADVVDGIESAAADATTAAELRAQLDVASSTTVRVDPEPGLEAIAIAELDPVRQRLREESVSVARHELVDGDPIGDLVAAIEDNRTEILDPPAAYSNVAEKAIYEARLAYYDLVLADLEASRDAHDAVLTGIDDELERVDAGIEDVTAYVREALSASEPEPGTVPSPPTVEGFEFEVAGSPTYLPIENVSSEVEPAIGANGTYAPLSTRRATTFSVPYDDVVAGVLDRIPFLDFGDDEVRVPLSAAAETLRAARLTNDLSAGTPISADDLEGAVESAVNHTVLLTATTAADELGVDRRAVSRAVDDALSTWETTDGRAIALGNGTGIEAAARATADALDDPPDGYDADAWAVRVDAVVRTILEERVANRTVPVAEGALERVDERVRAELANRSEALLEQRLGSNGTPAAAWFEGDSPKRVPSGIPILPVPGTWIATANVWTVDIAGSYARFELSSNLGTPATAGGTSYVRENATATVEVAGAERTLGVVEPIAFETDTVVAVVVPPGGYGVGDRTGDRVTCSPAGSVDADC